MSTPPPTYSAQVDNVDMDTNTNNLTDTNIARNNPTDTSDTETDDSMPDLIPASSVSPDDTTATNEAQSGLSFYAAEIVFFFFFSPPLTAAVPAGVTTLIQHIGSLSIASSVTNGVHPRCHPTISTDSHREIANTPATATTASGVMLI